MNIVRVIGEIFSSLLVEVTNSSLLFRLLNFRKNRLDRRKIVYFILEETFYARVLALFK